MTMEIKIAGLDYRSASVDVREKFTFTESERRELLREIAPYVQEAVLISTCNRTKLAVVSEEEPSELLHRACGCGSFFSLRGEAAVARIFEIAAGLHSQIPLEDQILGQMKEALTASREEKACGPLLGQLFQRAITAGKEVRTKYKALPHECSAAAAACTAAAEFFSQAPAAKDIAGSTDGSPAAPLRGVSALVVGSGEMGMLAAQLLRYRGASVRMTQRRCRKDGAQPPSGVTLIPYDTRYEAMRECALVICATASPHFVLTTKEFGDDGVRRMMIDLAVPRDIEPAFMRRPSVTLVDMDGLGRSALAEGFLREIKKSVAAHTARFHEWRQIHECMPYIEDVCAFAERELANELGCADAEEFSRVRAASRSMMNKLLFSLKERVDIDMAKECYCALAKAVQR
ncbi:glutamyl-tRNA reductase [Cloacibacillus sp.]